MPYTQSDYDNIKAALLNLALGNRVVRVVVEGKVCEFGQADIDQLRKLLSDIAAELDAASGNNGLIYTTTRKAL